MKRLYKKIAIIVPVHNRREITLHFMQQMHNLSPCGTNYDLIIVDDGSTDDTSIAIRRQYPEVTVLNGDGNLWWTGAVVLGVEHVLQKCYDAVLIMNDDLELDGDFLPELLKVAELHPHALVSSIKLNRQENGQKQIITAGFRVVGMLKEIEILHRDEPYREDLDEVVQCDVLTGSALLIPREVFQTIGMFNKKMFPHHWGDFEFTRRASLAGLSCLVATRSKIYTEYNPNYSVSFFLNSTRLNYMRNLFSTTKYFYGFRALIRASYMHKGFMAGSLLFARRSCGLVGNIFLKLVLPNRILRSLVQSRR